MNSKMLATLAALALTTALVDAGCMARGSGTDEITDGQEEAVTGADSQAVENTGEANQACGFGGGFGWSGFGWSPFLGCGGFGWSGFGWSPFLGCGGFGWAGIGCGGFGWAGGCW